MRSEYCLVDSCSREVLLSGFFNSYEEAERALTEGVPPVNLQLVDVERAEPSADPYAVGTWRMPDFGD